MRARGTALNIRSIMFIGMAHAKCSRALAALLLRVCVNQTLSLVNDPIIMFVYILTGLRMNICNYILRTVADGNDLSAHARTFSLALFTTYL